MNRAEILQQAAQKLQKAKETLLGQGIDCGTPYILKKVEIWEERDRLLAEHGYESCLGDGEPPVQV